MSEDQKPKAATLDEPLKIDLDPEDAIRGLSQVDPDAPVPQDEPVKDQGDKLAD